MTQWISHPLDMSFDARILYIFTTFPFIYFVSEVQWQNYLKVISWHVPSIWRDVLDVVVTCVICCVLCWPLVGVFVKPVNIWEQLLLMWLITDHCDNIYASVNSFIYLFMHFSKTWSLRDMPSWCVGRLCSEEA